MNAPPSRSSTARATAMASTEVGDAGQQLVDDGPARLMRGLALPAGRDGPHVPRDSLALGHEGRPEQAWIGIDAASPRTAAGALT